MKRMRVYGLIGKNLSHSWSKDYFQNKFQSEGLSDCTYQNFEVHSLDSLRQWIRKNKDLAGLNITTPYKVSVIPYLDHLEAPADTIMAVNCIRIVRHAKGEKLIGLNTDAPAFSKTLNPYTGDNFQDALVLGTGGAARAVGHVLSNMGIRYMMVSRKKTDKTLTYEEITENVISTHPLIINATPLGMFPGSASCPGLPYDKLSKHHVLYDLVYNPEETLFLKHGKDRGCKVKNGLEMLHLQAEMSWENWKI